MILQISKSVLKWHLKWQTWFLLGHLHEQVDTNGSLLCHLYGHQSTRPSFCLSHKFSVLACSLWHTCSKENSYSYRLNMIYSYFILNRASFYRDLRVFTTFFNISVTVYVLIALAIFDKWLNSRCWCQLPVQTFFSTTEWCLHKKACVFCC